MSTTAEALRAGDIAAAIAAAQAKVKAAPRDADARWLLAELLLLSGDAERADRMLDAAVLDDPNPAVLEFRRLLRAEVVRQQVWAEGRAPNFQGQQATPAQEAALRAIVALRAGDAAGAAAAAAEAEATRPRAPGTAELVNGKTIEFDDIRDADDLIAPGLEILTTAGEHMLVSFERLGSLAFTPGRRPRDVVWRRAEITLKDGSDGVIFVPALYPRGTGQVSDQLRLGRVTEWEESGEGDQVLVRGMGQRLWLMGEEAVPISEVATLRLG
ncbi:type VI secretion system accessory protein TagJ [Muricoccus radiodurans]|uniref:type VI secretion system accessory protein TagJ n=1 Tax=Muricoccus radiodurans TaxID=2231721 RepID=UPI003CF49F28